MIERGVGYQELAEQFGVEVQTLRHALGQRQPPTQASGSGSRRGRRTDRRRRSPPRRPRFEPTALVEATPKPGIAAVTDDA
jgi:hypothetical protein